MKVTAIEKAHDITTLKLDELFGSLLTFEMAISDRKNKKANMNESIALLMEQFSKVVKKFKNMNTTRFNAQNLNHYRRKDSENTTRRYNEASNRRDGDYGMKKEEEGRSFRYRECGEVCHYQVECPTFLRRQKKNFQKKIHATLSDEDTNDSEEDNGMNAFTVRVTKTDFDDESESSKENCDNELTFEELRKEDTDARAIQKESIQDLMEENE
ncbi:gag-proteinase polyprotein [Cucumis melo var. makuwa]|uniref:Gag-proteinase polyprotein n=1 Tax=Cucumis melo var. makuwa TaxID=1194695 RepID=A0A5A7UCJ5_CUCMM|nr:gag-proteinase polyprotein [Cucumis melo var. makuwa]TYK19198.1 gag-proteinase polyprotein [Cucumis melo var. makuwa]